MTFFKCEICGENFPTALHHEHHKVPKSLGGSDEKSNLSDLCSSCHQHLHTVAFMIVNPKRRHEIDPTLIAIFGAEQNKKIKLVEFSKLVAKEMLLKKEIRKDSDSDSRTVVDLPSRYMELLRLSGYDSPHANGRKAGVNRIIKKIVAEYLIRKFPMHQEEIRSLLNKSAKKPKHS